MSAPIFAGDGICSLDPTRPTDLEAEADGAAWLRFIQATIQNAFDNEHTCAGEHKYRGVVSYGFADSPVAISFASHAGKVILVDTTLGAVTLNLDVAAAWKAGVPLFIKKVSIDPNIVIINAQTTLPDVIDGAPSFSLDRFNNWVLLMPDGVFSWASFSLVTVAVGGAEGTWGDSTHVPQITVNAAGNVILVDNVPIDFPPNGNVTYDNVIISLVSGLYPQIIGDVVSEDDPPLAVTKTFDDVTRPEIATAHLALTGFTGTLDVATEVTWAGGPTLGYKTKQLHFVKGVLQTIDAPVDHVIDVTVAC